MSDFLCCCATSSSTMRLTPPTALTWGAAWGRGKATSTAPRLHQTNFRRAPLPLEVTLSALLTVVDVWGFAQGHTSYSVCWWWSLPLNPISAVLWPMHYWGDANRFKSYRNTRRNHTGHEAQVATSFSFVQNDSKNSSELKKRKKRVKNREEIGW